MWDVETKECDDTRLNGVRWPVAACLLQYKITPSCWQTEREPEGDRVQINPAVCISQESLIWKDKKNECESSTSEPVRREVRIWKQRNGISFYHSHPLHGDTPKRSKLPDTVYKNLDR